MRHRKGAGFPLEHHRLDHSKQGPLLIIILFYFKTEYYFILFHFKAAGLKRTILPQPPK